LTAGQAVADGGSVAVLVGCFDQQPTAVDRARLGDRALAALLVGGVLGRDDPEEPGELLGPETLEVADLGAQSGGHSVSIPRKQRNLAIVAAWALSGMTCSSAAISAARRATSISTPDR
jgi:hypothetical protein